MGCRSKWKQLVDTSGGLVVYEFDKLAQKQLPNLELAIEQMMDGDGKPEQDKRGTAVGEGFGVTRGWEQPQT